MLNFRNILVLIMCAICGQVKAAYAEGLWEISDKKPSVVNKDSLKRDQQGAKYLVEVNKEWQKDSAKNVVKATQKRVEKYNYAVKKYDYIPAMRWLYEYYRAENPDDAQMWMPLLQRLADREHNHVQSQYDLAQCYRIGTGDVEENSTEYVQWVQTAADGGYIEACYETGICFYVGIGIQRDYETAFKYFQNAVNGDHLPSHYYLGKMFLKGEGVAKDVEKAIFYFDKAADRGYADAQMALGYGYLRGNDFDRNYSQASRYFQSAAEKGKDVAQYQLAMMYYEGKGFRRDAESYAKAFEWMSKAAEQNYSDAQYMLGVFYRDGIGVPADAKQAVLLFHAAAEQNHPEAQYALACCYAEGYGTDKNLDQAERWWKTAADNYNEDAMLAIAENAIDKGEGKQALSYYMQAYEKGNKKACLALANLYRTGAVGVAVNYKEAFRFYEEASQWNDTHALFCMGQMYSTGEGCSIDLSKSVECYKKSAERQYAPAVHALAVCYYLGQGVEQNYTQALLYFEKAGKDGYVDSQYSLALCYANGQGTDIDYDQAVQWFSKAAEQGHAQSQYYLASNYYSGNLFAANMPLAYAWSRKAVEQGEYADLEYNLGMMCYNGNGTMMDANQAYQWFLKSANHNYVPAMVMLGICYRDGKGVGMSQAMAREWLTRAKTEGSSEAAKLLQNL